MPSITDRIVLIPRYTPMIGANTTYSAPIDVRAFCAANLVAWQGVGLGSTPAEVEFTFQESLDLENWNDMDSLSPAAGTEETLSLYFQFAWLRVKTVMSGSDPGVTTWLQGEFVRRDSGGDGA